MIFLHMNHVTFLHDCVPISPNHRQVKYGATHTSFKQEKFGIWNRFWNRSFIFGHIYIIRGQPWFHSSASTANYDNFIFSDVYLQSDDFHSAAFFVCVLWLTADYRRLRLPGHSWTANDGAHEHLETIKTETDTQNSSKWIEYNSK